MFRFAAFFACLLISLMCFSRSPAQADVSTTNQEHEFFDLGALTEIINSLPEKTIEGVLSNLPKRLTEFQYVLMPESRSRQSSTPENPRIIIYDESGDFLFGVSTNPESRLYNEIEFLQFDANQGRYIPGTIDFTNNAAIAKDPSFCQKCHTKRVRPIWGEYDDWIGAYDRGLAVEPHLIPAFVALVAAKPSHPRLKYFSFKNTMVEGSPEVFNRPVGGNFLNGVLIHKLSRDWFSRIKKSVHYKKMKWLLPAISRVGDSYAEGSMCQKSSHWGSLVEEVHKIYELNKDSSDIKNISQRPSDNIVDLAYRVAGVDPADDLQVYRLANERAWKFPDRIYSDNLSQPIEIGFLIMLQILDDLARENGSVRDLVSHVLASENASLLLAKLQKKGGFGDDYFHRARVAGVDLKDIWGKDRFCKALLDGFKAE